MANVVPTLALAQGPPHMNRLTPLKNPCFAKPALWATYDGLGMVVNGTFAYAIVCTDHTMYFERIEYPPGKMIKRKLSQKQFDGLVRVMNNAPAGEFVGIKTTIDWSVVLKFDIDTGAQKQLTAVNPGWSQRNNLPTDVDALLCAIDRIRNDKFWFCSKHE